PTVNLPRLALLTLSALTVALALWQSAPGLGGGFPTPVPSVKPGDPIPEQQADLQRMIEEGVPPEEAFNRLSNELAAQELGAVLASIPADSKVVIDSETVAVRGSSDPHDIFNPDKAIVTIHHIPSLSIVTIDRNGREVGRDIRSSAGNEALARALSNDQVVAALKALANR
ncbi:MAG TPA: hypothetical protein VFT91_03395, partial [Dehalococcoidia bacterium]|nr:hypothetical protein [Dehalococcoidia bacterium]